ncbi:MAG TPA: DUF2207 domain-containing protein [Gemmatimonadales bacterium]|nr:DUF2207 domain-containing protein [Gemmatimonadales bacterium]
MNERFTMLSRAVVLLIVLLLPVSLTAQDTGWVIQSFDAQYSVKADRTINVIEQITVDFGSLQKHGIYREIPVSYAKVLDAGAPVRAGTVKVGLDVLSVTDEQGRKLGTQVSSGNNVRIRIGDPDVTVSGVQTYIIRYRLDRGLGFFDDHDELYWQVTGTNWPVPILKASATVDLPADGADRADGAGSSAWCYAGWAESNSNERCTAAVTGPGQYAFSASRLDPGEGLTMVAAFPKGVIAAPTAADKLRDEASFWWPVLLPLLGFFGMFSRWRSKGREPDPGSIVPNWHPPAGLPPGAAGTLVDQRADMDDIVATLLDLAVRGYINIAEVPSNLTATLGEDSFLGKALRSLGLSKTDWELSRTAKPLPGDLVPYETTVLDGVFDDGSTTRRMSDLHNEFYTHISAIKEGMYDFLVKERLFPRSPASVRNGYLVLGILLTIAGIPIGAVTTNVVLGAGIALTGIIILAFSGIMPAKTADGARRWREVKGLEEYIRRAEKSELEMSQGPERTTELFSALLPYAVALDVSDIWVSQFAGVLASQPPNWYVGTSGQFNVGNFSSGLSSFQTAATRTMGSSPGSSSGSGGGGSVGGGGGGGGGGSW